MNHNVQTYEDAHGITHHRPPRPAFDAPLDTVLAWLRADAAFTDSLGSRSARVFDRAFRAGLKDPLASAFDRAYARQPKRKAAP